MREVFDVTFSVVNIIPAIALVFIMAYWLLVIFGALDLSSFDVELDLSSDIDIEADASYEAKVNATAEADVSWLNELLRFFNLGKIPLMVFLTFWTLPTWFLCVFINYSFGFSSFLIGLLVLLPTSFACLFLSKIITLPFVKIFQALDQDSDTNIDLMGQVCTVILPAETNRIGQAELFTQGSSYLLNIKTRKGKIEKGEKAMIVNYLAKEDCYIAQIHYSID